MKTPSRRAVTVLFAGILVACAANELPDKPVVRPYELSEEDIPLKSGLRVLVQVDHSAPVVAVVATYSVGSTSDPKGREGLAHLVEHLWFRTHFVDGVPVWDHIKRMGAEFNAETEWDSTMYYTVAHKDSLPELMQLEAWRLFKDVEGVTPEVFSTEREVVRQEHRLGNETSAGSKLFDTVSAALYPPGHPLSRSIGGNHDSISASTLEDARAFVRKHYRPDNCTIVVAGDVDPQEVRKLIGTWPVELVFGPGGANGPAAPPRDLVANRTIPPVPPPFQRMLIRDKGPVVFPELMIGWAVPGGHRHNDGLLDFTASRLQMALFQGIELKEEDDDIQGVFAFPEPHVDGSMLIITALLRPGANPDRVRTRILDAVVNTWASDFSVGQTEATRWEAATGSMIETGSLLGTAIETSRHLAATGSPSYFKDELEELAKIKPGEVTDLAYRYLGRDRSVAVYFEPESESAAKLVASAGRATGNPQTGGHDVGHGNLQATGDLDPTHLLQIARPPHLGSLPRFTLANGLEVVSIKYGAAPIARVSVMLKGGDALTQPYGLAEYASMFTRRRCNQHGSLEPVGGEIGHSVGEASTRTSVNVLSGNLANAIAVLSDDLSCREIDEELFQRHDEFLRSWSKNYKRVADRPDFIANQRLFAGLYPGHPYGVTAVDPESLKPVSFDDVTAFVRTHFRPGNALAVVVGDIDPAQTKELATKYLERWSGGGNGGLGLPSPPPPPTARKAFLADRPGATQAEVSIGCRLVDATADTLPVYNVTGAVVNELAWSVREEWGASYGVYANAATLPGGAAHLIIGGAIENRWVGRSVDRLLGIIEQVGSPKLDQHVFLVKRWDVAREFSQRFSSPAAIAGAIMQAAERGWPIDFWDKYPLRLAATTPAAVQAIMKPCVGHEIVAIAGDAASLRPQLESIGLKLEAN